ncbi:MAG: hypothetical protein WCP06_05045 [Verrucomicrobiota bacterium]
MKFLSPLVALALVASGSPVSPLLGAQSGAKQFDSSRQGGLLRRPT